MSLPLVTVVVPAREESASIADCLAALAGQDYPPELTEILVVDGDSADGTAEVARAAMTRLSLPGSTARAAVISNAEATTPSNLNRGLAEARGSVLCRVDARSLVPPHYVRRCVEILGSRPDVAVVGGAQLAVPSRSGAVGVGIARALNNRWGMGLSRYRRGAGSGISDTVYLGAFRTAQLRQVGGWDARLPTNQDFDLNRRLSSEGAVWFESGIDVGYRPRSGLGDLYRQYLRFGRAKARYWRLTGDRPRPRQVALLAVPPAAAAAALAGVLAHPPAAFPLALAAAAAALAVEVRGTDRPATGSLAAHLNGLLALAAVSGGWLAGAWGELVRIRVPHRPASR